MYWPRSAPNAAEVSSLITSFDFVALAYRRRGNVLFRWCGLAMPEQPEITGLLLAHRAQPRRHVVAFQLVAAARAVLVAGAHRPEAVAAACRQLIVALGAEVKVALNVRSAGRTARN